MPNAPLPTGSNRNRGRHGMAAGLNATQCGSRPGQGCSALVYHLDTAVAFKCPFCQHVQLTYPHVVGDCNASGVCTHA